MTRAGVWRGRAADSLRRAAVHRASAGFWRACAADAVRLGNGAGAVTLARRAAASVRLARWNVADARAYNVAARGEGVRHGS